MSDEIECVGCEAAKVVGFSQENPEATKASIALTVLVMASRFGLDVLIKNLCDVHRAVFKEEMR